MEFLFQNLFLYFSTWFGFGFGFDLGLGFTETFWFGFGFCQNPKIGFVRSLGQNIHKGISVGCQSWELKEKSLDCTLA